MAARADLTVWVVNASTLVTNGDVKTMTVACDTQLYWHLCPAWGLTPVRALYAPTIAAVPTGARVVAVVDTLDQADALGWHTEDPNGQIHGVVGAKVVLDQGHQALSGPYSVASVLSHELCELAVDASTSLWADNGGGLLIAYEVCDPCESDHYNIGPATVSNFVHPAWFDPHAPHGARFDHMGNLAAPFTMDAGGYWVQMQGGKVTQQFGEAVPDWVRQAKTHPASRAQRLIR